VSPIRRTPGCRRRRGPGPCRTAVLARAPRLNRTVRPQQAVMTSTASIRYVRLDSKDSRLSRSHGPRSSSRCRKRPASTSSFASRSSLRPFFERGARGPTRAKIPLSPWRNLNGTGYRERESSTLARLGAQGSSEASIRVSGSMLAGDSPSAPRGGSAAGRWAATPAFAFP